MLTNSLWDYIPELGRMSTEICACQSQIKEVFTRKKWSSVDELLETWILIIVFFIILGKNFLLIKSDAAQYSERRLMPPLNPLLPR
jgi:hypothetical protein